MIITAWHFRTSGCSSVLQFLLRSKAQHWWLGLVVYNFNPGTLEAVEGESRELEESLLYKDNIRIDRTTWSDPFQKRRGSGRNLAESSVLENTKKANIQIQHCRIIIRIHNHDCICYTTVFLLLIICLRLPKVLYLVFFFSNTNVRFSFQLNKTLAIM